MSAPVTFGGRLAAVIIPTKAQALIALFGALLVLALTRVENILNLVGISNDAIDLTRDQFNIRFGVIAHTQIASNAALVTFWASVGLVAYLICWGMYNALVEARNEVTLNTQYTNRGHWQGPIQTLALKAVGGAVLVLMIAFLKTGFSLWTGLADSFSIEPSLTSAGQAALAVLGLAVQLYLIFALVLVTFTPWYREETFTDQ